MTVTMVAKMKSLDGFFTVVKDIDADNEHDAHDAMKSFIRSVIPNCLGCPACIEKGADIMSITQQKEH